MNFLNWWKIQKLKFPNSFAGSRAIVNIKTDDEKTFFKDIDVVIEFGLEEATLNFLKHAHRNRVAFISGSTGLSHKTLKMMKKYPAEF